MGRSGKDISKSDSKDRGRRKRPSKKSVIIESLLSTIAQRDEEIAKQKQIIADLRWKLQGRPEFHDSSTSESEEEEEAGGDASPVVDTRSQGSESSSEDTDSEYEDEDEQAAAEQNVVDNASDDDDGGMAVDEDPAEVDVVREKGKEAEKKKEPKKKRRQSEERTKCSFPGCTKDYILLGRLASHKRQGHSGWIEVEGEWKQDLRPVPYVEVQQGASAGRARKPTSSSSSTNTGSGTASSSTSTRKIPAEPTIIRRKVVRDDGPPSPPQPKAKIKRRIQSDTESEKAASSKHSNSGSDSDSDSETTESDRNFAKPLSEVKVKKPKKKKADRRRSPACLISVPPPGHVAQVSAVAPVAQAAVSTQPVRPVNPVSRLQPISPASESSDEDAPIASRAGPSNLFHRIAAPAARESSDSASDSENDALPAARSPPVINTATAAATRKPVELNQDNGHESTTSHQDRLVSKKAKTPVPISTISARHDRGSDSDTSMPEQEMSLPSNTSSTVSGRALAQPILREPSVAKKKAPSRAKKIKIEHLEPSLPLASRKATPVASIAQPAIPIAAIKSEDIGEDVDELLEDEDATDNIEPVASINTILPIDAIPAANHAHCQLCGCDVVPRELLHEVEDETHEGRGYSLIPRAQLKNALEEGLCSPEEYERCVILLCALCKRVVTTWFKMGRFRLENMRTLPNLKHVMLKAGWPRLDPKTGNVSRQYFCPGTEITAILKQWEEKAAVGRPDFALIFQYSWGSVNHAKKGEHMRDYWASLTGSIDQRLHDFGAALQHMFISASSPINIVTNFAAYVDRMAQLRNLLNLILADTNRVNIVQSRVMHRYFTCLHWRAFAYGQTSKLAGATLPVWKFAAVTSEVAEAYVAWWNSRDARGRSEAQIERDIEVDGVVSSKKGLQSRFLWMNEVAQPGSRMEVNRRAVEHEKQKLSLKQS